MIELVHNQYRSSQKVESSIFGNTKKEKIDG